MYRRRTSRIKKIVRKWGVFMSAILKQKLIDIANGFTKYGLWKGGGSGGSSALSDMTDVTFTDLQANDILTYNGSVWVNDDNLHEYSTKEKVVGKWIDGRFNKEEVILQDDKAAFDVVRAAVNLVLASMLITIGTNYKLPLSTTYVTFMVAMGTSLADRAWSRESAVFRVTGVLSVIGGWFITAGVAFTGCALVCVIMFYTGIIGKLAFIALVVFLLIRSNRQYKKKSLDTKDEDMFRLMMRTRDPELVWDMLQKHVTKTQANMTEFALQSYNDIINGLETENVRLLRRCDKALRNERVTLKKLRRQELLALRRCPLDLAIERNTWFHIGANSSQQFIYSLRRMLEPIKEHVDNNFNPVPELYSEEFTPVIRKINELMEASVSVMSTRRFDDYRDILTEADTVKDELSALRKKHLDRMQKGKEVNGVNISIVYLNILQESQEFLSIMRHQLRALKKFTEA